MNSHIIKLTDKVLPDLRNCLVFVVSGNVNYRTYLYIDNDLNVRYYSNYWTSKPFAYAIKHGFTNHNHWVEISHHGEAASVILVARNVTPEEADEARENHHDTKVNLV